MLGVYVSGVAELWQTETGCKSLGCTVLEFSRENRFPIGINVFFEKFRKLYKVLMKNVTAQKVV